MYLYIVFEDGEALKLTAEPVPAEKQEQLLAAISKGITNSTFEYRKQ